MKTFTHVLFSAWLMLCISSVNAANYSLDAVTSLNDLDALLAIWGQEANENAFNTSAGSEPNAAIFNASYDWHSAVHSHFASIYAAKKLSKNELLDNILAKYSDYSVQSEVAYQPKMDETLYGYPWLLIYADYLADVEPEAFNHLKPLLNKVYNATLNNFRHADYSAYRQSIARGYRNYNFAALGLYHYAQRIKDTTAMRDIKNKISAYAPYIDWNTVSASEFFEPKAIALLTYKKLGITGAALNTVKAAYANTTITVPGSLDDYSSHAKGRVLNTAWGFWLMYKETNETQYLNAYLKTLDLVYQYLKLHQYYGNYFATVGHWLPHFGVIAIKIAQDSAPVTNPEDPVLIKDIIATPMEFSSHIDIQFPVAENASRVSFKLINWAGRTITSKTFTANKGNHTVRFDGLSFLWAETYTLEVRVGNNVFKKRVKRKWTWWW